MEYMNLPLDQSARLPNSRSASVMRLVNRILNIEYRILNIVPDSTVPQPASLH